MKKLLVSWNLYSYTKTRHHVLSQFKKKDFRASVWICLWISVLQTSSSGFKFSISVKHKHPQTYWNWFNSRLGSSTERFCLGIRRASELSEEATTARQQCRRIAYMYDCCLCCVQHQRRHDTYMISVIREYKLALTSSTSAGEINWSIGMDLCFIVDSRQRWKSRSWRERSPASLWREKRTADSPRARSQSLWPTQSPS